jgi:hypothetical protein
MSFHWQVENDLGACWTSASATGLHSGQAIGYLGGAQQADDIGVSLISGAGPLDVQAQHDDIKALAKGELTLMSLNGATELAADKKIVLKVDGAPPGRSDCRQHVGSYLWAIPPPDSTACSTACPKPAF